MTVSGGALDLNGIGYGFLTLNAGNFTASNMILELTVGADNDQVSAAGSGQSFSLTDSTIAISGSPVQSSYQVFSEFIGTNTVSNITFTGVSSGEMATLTLDGYLTFTAVPEPATWFGGGLLLTAGCLPLLRRRARA